MSRLNNIIKFCNWLITSIIELIGLAILCASLYVIFAKWGNLDTSFFLGIGVAFGLFGLSLMEMAGLGNMGMTFQEKAEGLVLFPILYLNVV